MNENQGKLLEKLQQVATAGVNHAANGLSDMVGDKIISSRADVQFIPILDVPEYLGGPENEVIGIYLRAEGQMAGQFMMILDNKKAFELVDVLMGEELGTTKELDRLGKSALAEIGNLTGTFFLNSLAEITGLVTMPTPPDVMYDMVGAVMNVIIAYSAQVVDEILAIRTGFSHGDQEVQLYFWYVPEPNALKAIIEKI